MGNFIGGPQDAKPAKVEELTKEPEGKLFSIKQLWLGKEQICLYELDIVGNYFFVGTKE